MTIQVQDNSITTHKQWQVNVYTSQDQTIPHTFYDETLVALREQVYYWLSSAQPTYIRSKSTYNKGSKTWNPLYTESNGEVYREFCRRGLDIQRGPEYLEQGFVDGKFQLEYVKTTVHHDDPNVVNQMLQCGWHILTLEKGEETGRTWYVLGHVEENAF